MYVITSKETNSVMDIFEKLDYLDNGYARNVEANIAYPDTLANVYSVETVPTEVEIVKYCYTETDGFYPNPDWKEPEPSVEDRLADMEMLMAEMLGGAAV